MSQQVILLLLLASTAFAYVPNLLHPYTSALIKLNEYDSTVRPPGTNNPDEPVNVTINLYVRGIEEIDHTNNEMKLQILFREEWDDSRLTFEGYSRDITTNEAQLIWKPDIFFPNERMGHFHTITKPNIFVRLRKEGHVLLSSRISLTISCPMSLWRFPFDTQTCELRMASYGYTTNDVILFWKNREPVQVAPNVHIPGYSLKDWDTTYCQSKTNTGEYSCLVVIFELKRETFPYAIRVFIPLMVLVFASWTSFWLPASAILPRLTVGSITTLTTALLIFREKEFLHLPSLTSLDVWVAVSAFFVFAAFFEYILLIFQASRQSDEKDTDTREDLEAPTSNGKEKVKKILCLSTFRNTSSVDTVSKIAFPVSYVLFHIVFSPFLF